MPSSARKSYGDGDNGHAASSSTTKATSSTPKVKESRNTASSKPQPASPSMLKGASLLIILQLISRLFTFVANQLLLRFLTAPLLGLSTQLEVYYLSVLFFARESLRVAIQRQDTPAATVREKADARDVIRAESQAVVNLGYLAIVLGAVFSVGLGWMYLAANAAALETPYLAQSLRLYGVAAMVELLSEPCFVLMQTRLQFGTRAAAESIATFLRCLVVFASAVWATRQQLDIGVLPFALGQLTYGGALLLVYLTSGYRLAASAGFSLLPKAVTKVQDPKFLASCFYLPTMKLAGSMMAQSFVKHLLTQGDTVLVSIFATAEVQGVYALANNYGGLLARLLFQPVEESSRSYFSRLLSISTNPVPAVSEKKHTKPSPAIEEARQNLYLLMYLYVLLSAAAITVGPFAAPSLLSIVAGRRWVGSGAGEVLSAYCFYIPFLALNGLTESFVASVATEAEVHIQSLWMGAFSVAFAGSTFLFMRVLPLGAKGLVLANIVNMLCRIVWSTTFIRRYFRKYSVTFPIRSFIPTGALTASIGFWTVMFEIYDAEEAESRPLKSLVLVIISTVPWILAVAFLERHFIYDCIRYFQSRRSGATDSK